MCARARACVVLVVVVVVLSTSVYVCVRVCVVVVVVVEVVVAESVIATNNSRSHHAIQACPPSRPSRGLRSVEIRPAFLQIPSNFNWSSSCSLYIAALISRVALAGQFNHSLSLNILRHKLRNWLN